MRTLHVKADGWIHGSTAIFSDIRRLDNLWYWKSTLNPHSCSPASIFCKKYISSSLLPRRQVGGPYRCLQTASESLPWSCRRSRWGSLVARWWIPSPCAISVRTRQRGTAGPHPSRQYASWSDGTNDKVRLIFQLGDRQTRVQIYRSII